MPEHGEYITEGKWKNSRWCEVHGWHHGHLYPCDSYPADVLQEIEADSERLRQSLNDPNWIQRQIDNGIPTEAVVIMRIFAGLEDK